MRAAIIFATLALPAASCASVAESTTQTATPAVAESEQPAPDQEWAPPEPDEGSDDWLRLKSGEWLRGEINVLRSESLEFDSNELDVLKIDWDDVTELRTTRQMTVGLTGRRAITGTLLVKGDQLVVGGETVMRYHRDELLSIIPGTPSELNYWSGKLSLGSTVRRGNTNQTDGNGDLRILRRSPDSRIELKFNGAYTRVSDVETSSYQRLDGKWDIFLSREFYVTPLFFEGFRDPFQNVELRFTPGAGAGYHLADRGGLTWDVDGGLGYQLLRYDSVEPGESKEQTSAAVMFGTTLDTDLTKRIEFEFTYSAQLAFNDAIGTNQHARGTLSVDLTGHLDLDLSLIWDSIGAPVADADGVIPQNDDYRFQVGLGWDF